MAEELRKRYKKLKLPKDAKIAFLSHHKATGGIVARLLHDRFCEILELPSSGVFLDSNDLTNLSQLPDRVGQCLVLCLLQTGGVLTRPYVLVEVYSAFQRNIPVVAVNVEGAGYDFADAERFLKSSDFGAELEQRNPGALQVLQDMRIDVQDMGLVLGQQIPKVVSSRLSPHESDRVLAVSIEVILDKILAEIERRAGFSNPGLVASSTSHGGVVLSPNQSTTLFSPAKLAAVDDIEKGPYAKLENDEDRSNKSRCCNCRSRREARVCYVRVFSWQMCLFWSVIIAAGIAAIIYFAVVNTSLYRDEFALDPIDTVIEAAQFGYSIATSDIVNGNIVRIAVGAPGFNSNQGTVFIYEYSLATLSANILQIVPNAQANYAEPRFGTKVLMSDNALMMAVGTVANSLNANDQDLFVVRQDDQNGLFQPNSVIFKQVRDFDWDSDATMLVLVHSNATVNTLVRANATAGNIWVSKFTFQAPSIECNHVALSQDGSNLALGCPSINGFSGGFFMYARTSPVDVIWSPNITSNGQMMFGNATFVNPSLLHRQGTHMSFSPTLTQFFVTGMSTNECYGFVFDLVNTTWKQTRDMLDLGPFTNSGILPDGCIITAKRLGAIGLIGNEFVVSRTGIGANIVSLMNSPNLFQSRPLIDGAGTLSATGAKGCSIAVVPTATLLVMGDPEFGSNGRVMVKRNVIF